MTAIAVPPAGALPPARNDYCELTAALARARRLYCDDGSKDQLLDALDMVAACARLCYREAGRRAGQPPGAEEGDRLAMLGSMVEYVELLWQYVDRFDKFGMLQDLNHLDRLLGSGGPAWLMPDAAGARSRRLPPRSLRG